MFKKISRTSHELPRSTTHYDFVLFIMNRYSDYWVTFFFPPSSPFFFLEEDARVCRASSFCTLGSFGKCRLHIYQGNDARVRSSEDWYRGRRWSRTLAFPIASSYCRLGPALRDLCSTPRKRSWHRPCSAWKKRRTYCPCISWREAMRPLLPNMRCHRPKVNSIGA
jgi:hypothetical protein